MEQDKGAKFEVNFKIKLLNRKAKYKVNFKSNLGIKEIVTKMRFDGSVMMETSVSEAQSVDGGDGDDEFKARSSISMWEIDMFPAELYMMETHAGALHLY